MKVAPRHAALVLPIAAALTVSGPSAKVAIASPSAAKVEVIDSVLAVVGDDVITETELERRARPFLAQAEKQLPVTADAPTRAAAARSIRDDMFERILDERAIQAEADELRIAVSAEEIERALDSVASAQGMSRDALLKLVADKGMTPESYRADLRCQLLEGKLLNLQVVPNLRPGLTGQALDEELWKARPAWIRDLRAAIYIDDRRGR